MTGLLRENKKSGEPGVYGHFVDDDDAEAWRTAMERVRAAMHARNAEMFARPDSRAEADRFVGARIDAVAACLDDLARLRSHGRFSLKDQLVTVRALLAGIVEAPRAHRPALLLRDRAVPARFLDLTLWDEDALRHPDPRTAAPRPTASSVRASTRWPPASTTSRDCAATGASA